MRTVSHVPWHRTEEATMAATVIETIPTVWDAARDVPFFQITARLFDPAFCLGASVLLATYDDGGAQTVAPAETEASPAQESLRGSRRLNRAR